MIIMTKCGSPGWPPQRDRIGLRVGNTGNGRRQQESAQTSFDSVHKTPRLFD
jgi:hypothetical protein